MTHWADVEAAELIQLRPGPQVFATAITPSGPIHVGNMREVLTSEAIFRATKEVHLGAAPAPEVAVDAQKLDASRAPEAAAPSFIYIADDYDPLRKVYPFLHDSYQVHVGKPLREIPCPDADGRPNGCGRHESYAEHFLEPFLSNLDELGIEPEVLSAYAMYQEGRFTETTIKALDEADAIKEIIERVSKRQLPKRWAPFNPQCPTCRKINGVEVRNYEFPQLDCHCTNCAKESGSDDPSAGDFQLDVREGGIGKLPWRIDWPARWSFLGVTFEASGKDHRSKGGSWDTGLEICQKVFDATPPHGIMYEFLNLKGKGAMHSSSGLAVSAAQVLHMTPPEVLRYLLMRQKPSKHIDFDPGLGVLNLVDEFDRLERVHFGVEENPGTFTEVERTYQLSCPRDVPEHVPNQVPYRHLVTVAQLANDVDGVEAILRRSGELTGGMDDHDRAVLAERIDHVRYWLQHFAPDNVRFQVQDDVPDVVRDEDRAFLAALLPRLETAQWTAEDIHNTIHEVAAERDVGQKDAFGAVYRSVLGKDRGPRAGFFVSSLDREFILDRFRAAST